MQYSWTNKYQKTFQNIKLTLSSILADVCFLEDDKFILNTDTSSFAIGARARKVAYFFENIEKN